jgi:5-carboxymethyl-2-hydroxymuconate isomerase
MMYDVYRFSTMHGRHGGSERSQECQGDQMPHIWIEYSANLKERVEQAGLLEAIHRAAIATNAFPIGGIRTRARVVADYRIADGHADNGFVHIVARIAAGRDQQTKKYIGESLFAELCQLMHPVYRSGPLGLSLEVQELDAELNFKQNNLQENAARRAHEAAA